MDRRGRGIRTPTVACSGARTTVYAEMADAGAGSGCGQRLDLEQESVDAAHDDGLAGGHIGGGDGVPEFAVDEDLSARGKRGLRDSGFADHSLSAGDHLVAAGFESDAHQECGDQAERNADRERGEQVDAHFRDGRIDEEQASEGEERDAADGEHAVTGELGFGGEKREGAENQAQRGKARGQQVQGEGRDQDEDDAHGSGNDRAGMIEFGVKRERADGEQDEGDVRVHQIVEDVFLERHAERRDGLAGELEGDFLSVEALEAFAVDLAEEIFFAGGHVVDQVLRESFLLGEGFGFEHRAFGDFDVAAAPGGDGAHEGGGIVLDFALHLVVGLDLGRAEEQDGMRRAGVGSGGHGRDVGGFEDEDSGRTGAAAGGGDVNDDGDLRVRDLLDDLAGGVDEASGSIDLDQYGLIVAALGFVDGAGNVFLGDGLNGVVDDDFEDFGGGDGGQNETLPRGREESARLECFSLSRPLPT